MTLRISLLAISILLTASISPATAKQADRQQPMDVASDHAQSAMSDEGDTVLKGNVVINQGSLQVQADAGTLKSKDGDITHAHFTGQPVKLNQQLDDGTPVDAVSREVKYDLATDTITFIGDVVLKKPTDTLQGERVVYNMRTGQINADGEGGTGRVKMHILPKTKSKPATSAGTGPITDSVSAR